MQYWSFMFGRQQSPPSKSQRPSLVESSQNPSPAMVHPFSKIVMLDFCTNNWCKKLTCIWSNDNRIICRIPVTSTNITARMSHVTVNATISPIKIARIVVQLIRTNSIANTPYSFHIAIWSRIKIIAILKKLFKYFYTYKDWIKELCLGDNYKLYNLIWHCSSGSNRLRQSHILERLIHLHISGFQFWQCHILKVSSWYENINNLTIFFNIVPEIVGPISYVINLRFGLVLDIVDVENELLRMMPLEFKSLLKLFWSW